MYKDLEFYLENMRLFPSVSSPELLGHDGEFLYYKMILPKPFVKELDKYSNLGLVQIPTEAENFSDLEWYPIYTGILEINSTRDLVSFRVRVPKIFIDSGLGVVYRGYDVW